MKELSIEDKAKAYDEVISKLKGFMVQGVDPLITRADVQDFFPELKESESEDEKIRKGLINGFNECLKNSQYSSNAQKYWHNIKIEDIFTWLEKQGEQKSAWSEEDALRLEEAIYMIKARGWIRSDDAVKLVLDWLKCLKDRVQPQPKQEWSVEDKSKVQRICEYLDEAKKYYADIIEVRECMDWLKSLKQRIGG